MLHHVATHDRNVGAMGAAHTTHPAAVVEFTDPFAQADEALILSRRRYAFVNDTNTHREESGR
jgi:hypothetical protein